MGMGSPTGSNTPQQSLSRPNSQPAPTQSGATALTQPPAGGMGGLGALQQFGQAGGFNPQFGGFGNQNPQNQQYRQYMEAWRNQRPEMQPGMDRDAFRQQMDAYRGMRPDRNNMPAPGYIPQQYYPSDGPNMPRGVGEPMPPQQQQDPAQVALLSQYNQMLQGSGQPGILANPATLTPQQIQSMQSALGAVAGAGAPPAPMQAVMPPAPNTQQIGREDPRMQAMRAMQMFANQRRG